MASSSIGDFFEKQKMESSNRTRAPRAAGRKKATGAFASVALMSENFR
jgi:hypothetical protein